MTIKKYIDLAKARSEALMGTFKRESLSEVKFSEPEIT